MIGIYGIHNTVTDTWYVGQSIDIQTRWCQHRNELYKKVHHNTHLQRAYIKYGSNAFEWVVLEECTEDELNELESKWISKKDSFYNGYNQTLGGDGFRGFVNPHCVEQRKPIVCLTTGEIFESVYAASRVKSIPYAKLKDCVRKQVGCKGWWEYLPENYSEDWREQKIFERKETIKHRRTESNANRPKKEPYVNPNGYRKWSEQAKKANKGKNGKAVIQLSLSGEYIAEFASSVIAGETLGINHRKIRMVCNGERNKCGNFKWKWKDSV